MNMNHEVESNMVFEMDDIPPDIIIMEDRPPNETETPKLEEKEIIITQDIIQEPSHKAIPNSSVDSLLSIMDAFKELSTNIEISNHSLSETKTKVLVSRQNIRDLSAIINRTPSIDETSEDSDLHISKVTVQHDDCGGIIYYAEQIRGHVYDNTDEAEKLLLPMTHNMDMLKLRIQHILLLRQLLDQQKVGLALEEKKRNADTRIQSLLDILEINSK